MPIPGLPRCAGALVRSTGQRARRATESAQSGFILLESIVAIALITVIMSAVGAEYVTSLATSNHARLQTVAAQIAESTLEQVRSIAPASRGSGTDPTNLLTNRTQSLVDTEYNALAANSAIASQLRPMSVSSGSSWTPSNYKAYVSSSTGDPTVPTTATNPTTVGPTRYSVWRYLQCAYPSSSGSCASTTSVKNNIQVFAVVTWPERSCPNSTCAFVTSTLVNDDIDPTFDLKQAPPAVPVPKLPSGITTTTNSSCNPSGLAYQVAVSVGDAVSIPLAVTANTGVPPFSWTADTLPTNVSLTNPTDGSAALTGTVGGNATSSGSPLCTKLQVTDAFSSNATPRIGTAYIAWTIAPALSFTAIADQASIVGDSVNLPLAATGGTSGTTYTFGTVAGQPLPTPLAISGSAVTGTVGRPSPVPYTYTVSLTVADNSSCPACLNSAHTTASTSFKWGVGYGPLVVTNPGTQTATVKYELNTAKQVKMAAATSGGDGSYTWSSLGSNGSDTLPTGLTLNSSTGVISGKPTQLGSYSVTITATDSSAGVDPKSVSFTWSVVNPPSLSQSLGARTDTVGYNVNFSTSPSCPDAPCSYTISSSSPPNLTLTSAGAVTGTIGGSPQTYSSVQVTVTDSAGAPATSNAFSWAVVAAPSVTAPAKQVNVLGRAITAVTPASTCPNTPCTFALQNQPAGLRIDSSTGQITGTPTVSAMYSNVIVQITDNEGFSNSQTASFTWVVTTTLAAAANNVGITKSSNISSGLFDRVGGNANSDHHSFSYENLTTTASPNTAITAGKQFSLGNDTYSWPTTAGSGSADNVVAQNQVIAYSASGANNIGFIVGTHNGSASANVTIVYTDGTSISPTLSATDWTSAAPSGSVTLTSKENINGATSSTAVLLYEKEVAISTSKQVAYIILPNTTANPYLHIFAISQPPLAAQFNTSGIATSSTVTSAGLDGGGYSLNYDAITSAAVGGPAAGATVSKNGISYQWPSTAGTGFADNVTPSGQSVPFTATGSSSLGFLVTGVNGSVTGSSASGTVNYTSGSATSFTITTPDWCSSGGSASVINAPSRYYKDGTTTTNPCATSVNYVLVTVDSTRTISSITLPNYNKLRIFAIGYGS